ncbi:MAG: hypothetical protein H7Z42_17740 [Roseiflexaceae bacterium]|nr:hypothetical protein [Roseiflexaceae bacterium]
MILHRHPRLMLCALLLAVLNSCTSAPNVPTYPPIGASTRPIAHQGLASAPSEVDLSRRRAYRHSDQAFTLAVPQGWLTEDISGADELRVRFTEPRENALMVANLIQIEQQFDAAALMRLLQAHIRDAYGAQPAFAIEPILSPIDGRIAATWRYRPTQAETSAQLTGTSFIQQHGTRLAVLSVIVPSAQHAQLAPAIAEIGDSLAFSAEVASRPLITADSSRLQPFTYPGGLFSLDVPQAWTQNDTSKPGQAVVTWSDPVTRSWLQAHVLQDDSQRSSAELRALVTGLVENAFAEKNTLSLGPAVPQADGSVLLEWSYTNRARYGLAATFHGYSFAHQVGDRIAIVSFVYPAEQHKRLASQMAGIRASFAVDATAPLP